MNKELIIRELEDEIETLRNDRRKNIIEYEFNHKDKSEPRVKRYWYG